MNNNLTSRNSSYCGSQVTSSITADNSLPLASWTSGLHLWSAIAAAVVMQYLLYVFISRKYSARNNPAPKLAKDEASFFNDIYLNQALSIVRIGFRRELKENDVAEVSAWEKCSQIYLPFESQWKKNSKERLEENEKPVAGADATSRSRTSLLQVLLQIFGLKFFFLQVLKMTNDSKHQKTTGKLISLITEDCDKVMEASTNIFYFMLTPCKVLVSMFLLYRQIGSSTFFGLALMLTVIPLNIWATRKIISHQENRDNIKDQRLKVLNEILNGIKVLKLYAWEKSFIDKISGIRNLELAAKKMINLFAILLEFSYRTIPFIVQVVCFSLFICSGGHFTPATAFVSSSLFGMLYGSFSALAYILPNFLQATVSAKKLNKFLNQEDIQEDLVKKKANTDSDVAIEIIDGAFTWQRSAEKETLKNIDLKISVGSLVAIVGMVGMGKTSLLSAILGQMQKVKGTVFVKGKTAYVPQEAWVQNMTLRDNILFGSEFQDNKYQKTLHACALMEDLKVLSSGDKTIIGERGINLSGGQKQRVSLARSVYSDADIYLMDDPLSAVDSHVGKHIFNNIIGPDGLLKNKTRVLVTHGTHWLPEVDEIIVVKDGSISEVGSFEKLMKSNGEFAQLFYSTLTTKSECPIDLTEKWGKFIKPQDCKVKVIQESHKHQFHDNKNINEDLKECNAYEKMDNVEDLTNDDQVETNISSKVFIQYMKSIGLKNCLAFITVFVLWMIFKEMKELWLGKWTEDVIIKNTTLQQTPEYKSLTNNYLFSYVIIGSFGIVLSGLYLYLVQSKTLDAANRLHLQLLNNIMRAPMSFFDTTPTGRIISRLSKDVNSVDGLGECLEEYVRCVGAVIMQLSVITYLNPGILPYIALVTCLFMYLKNLFSKTARQLRRFKEKNFSPIIDFFKETIHGLQTIRAYNAQKRFVSYMHATIENHLKYDIWEMFVGIWFDTQISILSYLIVLVSGCLIVCSGSISPAQAGLILMYSSEFVYSLGWFMTHSTHTDQELVSLEKILDYSNKPVEADWEIPETKPDSPWPQDGQVIFDNYKARYRDGLDLVLRGISCTIQKGEKIGIVGRTGAGKSSLMCALFRLMEAEDGQIQLDSCDISLLGLHDLRRNITILPQDPVIFGGSLRMNLDPLEEKTTAELWEALKHSHLKIFVESLPEKLDYDCGEGGKNLSVGQRQLICLARTLLRKSKILVLDEATASVDIETDELIQRTICTEFKDCTVLTIAHRINTILDYDRILVLDHGKVKEFDSPKSLLKNKNTSFYALAKDARLVT
ncbi:Multidrug resistance-associated protein 1 [Bulinus truncatus]|nr:Multidrug resistance-associated protein 1 [Bulinus truncatus]